MSKGGWEESTALEPRLKERPRLPEPQREVKSPLRLAISTSCPLDPQRCLLLAPLLCSIFRRETLNLKTSFAIRRFVRNAQERRRSSIVAAPADAPPDEADDEAGEGEEGEAGPVSHRVAGTVAGGKQERRDDTAAVAKGDDGTHGESGRSGA